MNILVFAEQRDNHFKKPALEAVRTAKTLADQTGGAVTALVISSSVPAAAGTLGGYGASAVKVVEHEKLGRYCSLAYAKIIAQLAKQIQASVVLIPATAMGKDVAPRVAVKLDAGLAADCTALTIDGGKLIATRPVYAGKAFLDIAFTSSVKVITLRPNVFPAGENSGTTVTPQVVNVPLNDADFAVAATEVSAASGKLDVSEADIIVSGGRGMKAPENFRLIEDLAKSLGAAVGASRAVVDAGWRPHEEQVGQTGKTVSPTLYIAVGISGAIQHLAGMSSSKYIVAINKDKDAPIFQVADYGIVADAFEVLPALTAEVRKLLGT
jgi:electron transfer flavoprotein alpha subunit